MQMPDARQHRRPPFPTVTLCLLLAGALCAQADADRLSERVEQIVNKGALSKAVVGVHVVAHGTGRVIYTRNGHRRMVPASNQKIITAAAALECLGGDYEV